MTNDRLSFDLTSEELDFGFKLIPEGWYNVEIDDCEDDLETSNNNPQYLVKYKSTDESFKGLQWDYIAITPKSMQNIISLVRAAGFPVPTKEKPGKLEIPTADELIGKELQIEIVHEDDHKGQTDDDGNVLQRARVRYAGRKKIGEKTGKAAPAATTAKGKAKATKEDGFAI